MRLDSESPFDPYARSRHVRYAETNVVYHVISKTRGSLFLMRPDRYGKLRRIVAGILAVAKSLYPNVANYALSILSNHLHALLATRNGDHADIGRYIGFVKKELTRRWRHEVGWNDSIWAGYQSTAIITPKRQVYVLEYVLGQGVKEGLVESPLDWPGFHCAESLVTGRPVQGYWFDASAYGKAFHAEKVKKNPRPVDRDNFKRPESFSFDRLPALEDLTESEHRAHMRDAVDRIVKKCREIRGDKPVLGVEKICAMNPLASAPAPKPPWFKERQRQIVWDDPTDPDVQDYVSRYWDHQIAYRSAAARWNRGEVDSLKDFPEVCFIPGRRSRPISHMEESTA